ncbi:hypothetical protein AT268_28050 [Bacillus cereus]|uniref:Uncharacterized protein n=1 Tax=Bacillus cereus TaxID=1396 RepID=A0A9X0MGC2_BACCE|nr:hypothetical protein [Bacillus cereus]KXY40011.1 hypothetical protein AT268_28050 [Bacillus cereus]
MKKKILCLFTSFALIAPLFGSTVKAAVDSNDCKQCTNEPLTKEMIRSDKNNVVDLTITDENFNIALEIAESDLEETTIKNSDGTLSSSYQNELEAGVSKEVFVTYLKVLESFNYEIQKGNLEVGNGLKDLKFKDQNSIKDIQYVSSLGVNFYYLTNSDLGKVNKILGVGGTAAALAGALGITVGLAAPILACAAFLGAGLNACNWFDKGIFIKKTASSWACWPSK